MNDELETTLEESDRGLIEVQSGHVPGRTEKHHKIPQDIWCPD
jgi:hypothetical protein